MYNVTIDYDVSYNDILDLSEDMRDEEVEEVWAASGSYPLEAIFRSVERSKESFVAKQDGEVLCIGGLQVNSPLANSAVPWLLTTNKMKTNPRALIYFSRKITKDWRKQYKVLSNYVDSRYSQSLRWARGVGFDVFEAEPFGPFDMPFNRIEMRNI